MDGKRKGSKKTNSQGSHRAGRCLNSDPPGKSSEGIQKKSENFTSWKQKKPIRSILGYYRPVLTELKNMFPNGNTVSKKFNLSVQMID